MARLKDKSTGIEMVLIPAGSFVMGASPGDTEASWDERPAHRVTISRPFYLGRFEVTNAEFRLYKADHDSGKYRNTSLSSDGQPVVNVSWDEAQAFCKRYSLRLPTEAEWEYACRAGTTTKYPWGNDPGGGREWANVLNPSVRVKYDLSWEGFKFEDGHDVSAPVGSFRANAFGLYDMIGNVWEWCVDWFGECESRSGGITDPQGPSFGTARVFRGGSWYHNPNDARSSARGRDVPMFTTLFHGFRAAKTP